MIIRFGIPVKRETVNLIDVHPEMRARLRRVVGDVRITGRIRVSSGARTWDSQNYLYGLYSSGRGNLAAHPGPKPGEFTPQPGKRYGSAHQIQHAGGYKVGGLDNTDPWAYAVDIGFYKNANTKLLMDVCNTHGLTDNVPSEWWHYVAPNRDAPLVGLFGRGSTGDNVKSLQQALANLGYKPGIADGEYGPSTQAAVEHFQRDENRAPHGDWEPADQQRLKRRLKRTKKTSLGKLPLDAQVHSWTKQIRTNLDHIDKAVGQ